MILFLFNSNWHALKSGKIHHNINKFQKVKLQGYGLFLIFCFFKLIFKNNE